MINNNDNDNDIILFMHTIKLKSIYTKHDSMAQVIRMNLLFVYIIIIIIIYILLSICSLLILILYSLVVGSDYNELSILRARVRLHITRRRKKNNNEIYTQIIGMSIYAYVGIYI